MEMDDPIRLAISGGGVVYQINNRKGGAHYGINEPIIRFFTIEIY
jgi:hypothetical protein